VCTQRRCHAPCTPERRQAGLPAGLIFRTPARLGSLVFPFCNPAVKLFPFCNPAAKMFPFCNPAAKLPPYTQSCTARHAPVRQHAVLVTLVQCTCARAHAGHAVLPTPCWSRRAAHAVLPTPCCPRRAAHAVLPTPCCPRRAAHAVLVTPCCPRRAAHASATCMWAHPCKASLWVGVDSYGFPVRIMLTGPTQVARMLAAAQGRSEHAEVTVGACWGGVLGWRAGVA